MILLTGVHCSSIPTKLFLIKSFFVRYNVCIRPEAGVCCIQYQVCADQSNAFSLGGGGTKNMQSVLDENCPIQTNPVMTLLSLDYIEIIGEIKVFFSIEKGKVSVRVKSHF
jgi:hypothetical protein